MRESPTRSVGGTLARPFKAGIKIDAGAASRQRRQNRILRFIRRYATLN